jgi:hypothetical protein
VSAVLTPRRVVKRLEPDVAADKAVIIGFRIADIYPELFTFEKGERKGQPGVAIKGRLLRIKFAKVNGESIDVPQPARPDGARQRSVLTARTVRSSFHPSGSLLPGAEFSDLVHRRRAPCVRPIESLSDADLLGVLVGPRTRSRIC